MRADIAEAARTEQRITNAMAQHIAIRMADGAFLKWQFNPADYEFAAFRKAMQIVADARSCHL